MSQTTDKSQRGRRIQQKYRHMARQMAIRRARAFDLGGVGIVVGDSNNPHRYHKTSGVTCGDSNCCMCGNPRKFFNQPTQQEKRNMQDMDNTSNKRGNGAPAQDE